MPAKGYDGVRRRAGNPCMGEAWPVPGFSICLPALPGSDPAAARNVLAHPHYTPCPIRTSPIAAETNFFAISFLQIFGALLAHTLLWLKCEVLATEGVRRQFLPSVLSKGDCSPAFQGENRDHLSPVNLISPHPLPLSACHCQADCNPPR